MESHSNYIKLIKHGMESLNPLTLLLQTTLGIPTIIKKLGGNAQFGEDLLRMLAVFHEDNFPGSFLIECAAVVMDDLTKCEYEQV